MIKKLLVFGFVLFLLAGPLSVQAQNRNNFPEVRGVNLERSDLNGVLMEFSFPDYQIEEMMRNSETYQRIVVPETIVYTEPHKPQLPVQSVLIGVPPDAVIELAILEDNANYLSGNYRLPLSPIPAPLLEDLQPGEFVTLDSSMKAGVELSESIFPNSPAHIVDDAWLRDQRFVRIEVFPFQYDPQSGTLIWHKYLKIEVSFVFSGGESNVVVRDFEGNPNPFEQILQSSLLNYDSARHWRGYPRNERHELSGLNTETGTQGIDSLENPSFKIVIDRDGFYRLNYETLALAGLPVDDIDPSTFKMTNQGHTVSIYLYNAYGSAENFDPGDYILFYGQKFSGDELGAAYSDENVHWRSYPYYDGTGTVWQPEFSADMLEKYTDDNIYWLTFGGENGTFVEAGEYLGGDPYTPASYRDTVHYEESVFWRTTLFAGEDTWFWDKLEVSNLETRTYTTTLTFPATGMYTATLRGEVIAQDFDTSNSPDHRMNVSINDQELIHPVLSEAWDGKGSHIFEAQFPQDRLSDNNNQIVMQFEKVTGALDTIFINWFEIEYERQFHATDNQIWFTEDQAGTWKYEIDGFDGVSADDLVVYEITDPRAPKVYFQDVEITNGTVKFPVTLQSQAQFYAGIVEDVPAGQITPYYAPNLTVPAEYVFITHRDLLAGTQSLADYRSSQGVSTLVVDVEDLYNKFNYGIYHPIAIKNFLASTINENGLNWGDLPTYVLLVGDGHWNFKEYLSYDSPPIYMPPNLSWVDPWQGEVDSANLLATVSGDDALADVLIARLPVNSQEELQAVIDKITTYESYDEKIWQRRFLFVADDSDDLSGNFAELAESLINDYVLPDYYPSRIYLQNFECEKIDPDDPHSCPQATQVLINTLNDAGALLVNYIGHSYLNGWTDERILINEDLSYLGNNETLPVILSATCLDGYWIYPNKEISSGSGSSLIEDMIRVKNRGAVAAFSPTGLGVSTGHEFLQLGFYYALFNDGVDELGLASAAAKLNLYNAGVHQDLLHTFTMFGDPALKLIVPPPLDDHLYLPLVNR